MVHNKDAYIDLGLPSGTLWFTYNIGAGELEEAGDYYRFGEAQELKIQLPTRKQLLELIKHTTSEWCAVNGVNGRRFTGPNDNSIFLPAAGIYDKDGRSEAGKVGYYWSSSLCSTNSNYANYLYLCKYGVAWGFGSRSLERSVRPVKI